MDNSTPQPTQPNSDQGATNQTVPSTSSAGFGGGMKVIQPLSPNLQAETPTQPTSPSSAPLSSQASQDTSTSASTANQVPQSENLSQPLPNASSIYPDVTRGIGSNPAQPPVNQATQQATGSTLINSNKTKLITMAVIGFGAFVVVVAALGLITWIRVLKLPGASSGSNILGLILDCIELILGIGIMMKREAARSAYMFVAVILLIFSLYGTYNYLTSLHRYNQSQQAYINHTQQTITQYQNNPNISASDKAQIIKSLQDTEKREQQQVSKTNKTLLPFIEGYAISLLPLVFLSRPSVKEIFE